MNSSISSSRKIAWAVWVVASLFYAYQYILRVMPSIMSSDIMEQFGIGAAAFGQFSGVYYLGYALLHLPIGIMLDRFGPRKIMTGSILLTVVGLMPLLFASYWVYPVAGRFLIGLGSSAAILGLFKIIRMSFSEARFPRMLSLSVTIGLIGAIYGGGPVSYMRESLGYQTVVQIFAWGGVLLAALTYWILPPMAAVAQSSVLSSIKEVLSNRKVVLASICAGLMVGPLEGFADVWGALFLKQNYGFSATVAASISSMIFMGMCFGAPLLSFIAEKVGSHLATIIGAGVVMALAFSLLLIGQLPSAILSVAFILIGISCAYQILAIYKASTYVREEVAGLTTAVANMIIMTFGYAFHAVIGSLVNAHGGAASSGAMIYGISVIPAALLLGTSGFCFLWVRERQSRALRV